MCLWALCCWETVIGNERGLILFRRRGTDLVGWRRGGRLVAGVPFRRGEIGRSVLERRSDLGSVQVGGRGPLVE